MGMTTAMKVKATLELKKLFVETRGAKAGKQESLVAFVLDLIR